MGMSYLMQLVSYDLILQPNIDCSSSEPGIEVLSKRLTAPSLDFEDYDYCFRQYAQSNHDGSCIRERIID
jgi:hypothetical protein